MAKIGFAGEEQVLQDLLYFASHRDIALKAAQIAASGDVSSKSSEIVKKVVESLGNSSVDIERILATFQNLERAQTRMRMEPAQLFQHFSELIKQECGADENRVQQWEKSREVFISVLKMMGPDNPLHIARKAERLQYFHQNILNESRIITDLRPVFDKTGDRIHQSIVTFTLILDFIVAGFPHRIELGLDADDLAELRICCERAQREAITLKEALRDKPWVSQANTSGN